MEAEIESLKLEEHLTELRREATHRKKAVKKLNHDGHSTPHRSWNGKHQDHGTK